jgi:hypothetical protein
MNKIQNIPVIQPQLYPETVAKATAPQSLVLKLATTLQLLGFGSTTG